MLNKIDTQQVQLDTSEPIGHQQTSSSVIKMPTFSKGGLGLGNKVGTPTGEFTKAGKPMFLTPEGEQVSEKSMTLPHKDKWVNVPSIQKGVRYDEDQISEMLDKKRIQATSTHATKEEAVSAAEARSPALVDGEERKIMGRKIDETKQQTKKLLNMAQGGMLQEGGTVDPVSGNKVPVGAMKEEVRDDVPAQLSEGEFVFPADVVRYIGLERLMQMRQAAKKGLMQMEDMGQMSNGEEGSEEEDTSEFESELDDIMSEMEGEDRKMAVGGDVMPMEQAPAEQPTAPAMTATPAAQQTPEAIPTGTETPTLTEEQMAKIQETAKNMQNRKIDIDQTLLHPPTQGLASSTIVTDSLAAEGYKGKPDVFLRALAIRAAQKKAAVARFSDTIFVGVPVDPTTMQVHLFTKDDPKKLRDSIQAGIQTLQNVGTTRIQSTTTNQSLLNMLKKLQYPMSVQEDNGTFNWTMEIGK